jgi:hypothetical protein
MIILRFVFGIVGLLLICGRLVVVDDDGWEG